MSLGEKVILITGAAQGFGRAIALECARSGAAVIACDLDDCTASLKLIEAEGATALGLSFDITDYSACADAIEQALAKFDRLDGLVNCGALYGALNMGPFESIDPDEWDLAMKVNVRGTWQMCKAVTPCMRAAKNGSIVNISSNSALFGPALMCHYVASKAAVIGLTRTIASELGPDNIRVNAVCPGPMNTEGSAKAAGDNLQAMLESSPRPRLNYPFMEPEQVTGTIKFLLSDDSTMMTGQILTSDAGMTTL